jgi:hypothetical protein
MYVRFFADADVAVVASNCGSAIYVSGRPKAAGLLKLPDMLALVLFNPHP